MRLFSLRRWRVRELLLSWVVYWAVLLLVLLGPAALALWRASHASGAKAASVNAQVTGSLVSLTISGNGSPVWVGSMHVSTLLLLIAGPPLLAWLGWVATHTRAAEARDAV